MENQKNEMTEEDWKTRNYLAGAFIGAVLGVMSAYLFARSAEENDTGKPEPIPTGTLIGLLLSVMALVRQIAETGKPKPNKK